MAENKKSFLLYCDIIFTVKKLTDEQAGKLFKHILSYVNDENPEMEDTVLDLVFEPIKQSLKRDLMRYENICKRNQINGLNGGRPIKEPKKPTGLKKNPNNPEEPKKPDIDSDSDIDIDSEEYKNKIIFKKAVDWMNENTPLVLKLSSPFTEPEFTRLRRDFTNDQIKHLLLNMQNWKPLLKKSTSANLTFRNWSKRPGCFNDMVIEHKNQSEQQKEFSNPYWDLLKPEYR